MDECAPRWAQALGTILHRPPFPTLLLAIFAGVGELQISFAVVPDSNGVGGASSSTGSQDGAALAHAFEAFQQVGACGIQRNVKSVLESNTIFDANWNAETGEMHEPLRAVLHTDPNAFFFMVQRAFASGLIYSKTEAAYLDCLAKDIDKHGLEPYLQVLGKAGLATDGDVETKHVLASFLLAIGVKDGKLVLSQHLNELTVERMRGPIQKHLAGKKRSTALQLVNEYGNSLATLTERVEAVGRMINNHFEL